MLISTSREIDRLFPFLDLITDTLRINLLFLIIFIFEEKRVNITLTTLKSIVFFIQIDSLLRVPDMD